MFGKSSHLKMLTDKLIENISSQWGFTNSRLCIFITQYQKNDMLYMYSFDMNSPY